MRRREFMIFLGGAAAAWPLRAFGQQTDRIRRIGLLSTAAEHDPEVQSWIAVLMQGLRQLGWMEGRNLRIDFRFIAGDFSRLSTVAKELIELQPDLIVAVSTPVAAALRQQTLSIPIVFVQVTDPVAIGLVASPAHPGGNITGFINFEHAIGSKWLEALKETAPGIKRVAVIFDPGNPSWIAYMRAIEAAAPSSGVGLVPAGVSNAAEIGQAVDAFARESNGGMVVLPSAPTVNHRKLIIELAARQRLPAIYPYRFMAAEGGLLSYGVEVSDLYRRAASYVDRILKGEKPGDLPVQTPTKFELVINLKTAKALGLAIPESFLLRADEVIE